jgi:hypothetical protein
MSCRQPLCLRQDLDHRLAQAEIAGEQGRAAELVGVAGDVAPATSKDPIVISETRNREMELSELSADAAASPPPAPGRGFFGWLLESMGF